MRRLATVLMLALALALLVTRQPPPVTRAAAPDPALNTYCNGCNLIGARNIQLGSNQDPDGDIGAGSAAHPGRLSLCWDLCARGLVIYDSEHHPLARFGPGRRIVFYVKPVVR